MVIYSAQCHHHFGGDRVLIDTQSWWSDSYAATYWHWACDLAVLVGDGGTLERCLLLSDGAPWNRRCHWNVSAGWGKTAGSYPQARRCKFGGFGAGVWLLCVFFVCDTSAVFADLCQTKSQCHAVWGAWYRRKRTGTSRCHLQSHRSMSCQYTAKHR